MMMQPQIIMMNAPAAPAAPIIINNNNKLGVRVGVGVEQQRQDGHGRGQSVGRPLLSRHPVPRFGRSLAAVLARRLHGHVLPSPMQLVGSLLQASVWLVTSRSPPSDKHVNPFEPLKLEVKKFIRFRFRF